LLAGLLLNTLFGLYALEGREPELAKLAGQKVTVKGTRKGDTLSVQEVAAPK
jgi:hypothetical protein